LTPYQDLHRTEAVYVCWHRLLTNPGSNNSKHQFHCSITRTH